MFNCVRIYSVKLSAVKLTPQDQKENCSTAMSLPPHHHGKGTPTDPPPANFGGSGWDDKDPRTFKPGNPYSSPFLLNPTHFESEDRDELSDYEVQREQTPDGGKLHTNWDSKSEAQHNIPGYLESMGPRSLSPFQLPQSSHQESKEPTTPTGNKSPPPVDDGPAPYESIMYPFIRTTNSQKYGSPERYKVYKNGGEQVESERQRSKRKRVEKKRADFFATATTRLTEKRKQGLRDQLKELGDDTNEKPASSSQGNPRKRKAGIEESVRMRP